jgi:thiamine biosynthesis lipoprotein
MEPANSIEYDLHKKIIKLMGNRFEITVVHSDTSFADECITAAINEISRIEQLLTTFKDSSQTNQINAMAGLKPVQVDREVFDLIARSQKISQLTQGAFDLSYGSIDKSFWNFDTTMTSLPDAQKAKNAVRLINYNNIILDEKNTSVFLKEKGMRIGFGGFGKGYAADKARQVLINKGITKGVVNAAGDLVTIGTQANGYPWTVGIADPDTKYQPFSQLAISNKAVATSGNYEKFVIIGGKKYSHTIDPKTGFPVSGIKSVTIISQSAELADAMTTPVMVMGIKAGLHMINQLKQLACIIIDDNNIVYTSNNVKITDI